MPNTLTPSRTTRRRARAGQRHTSAFGDGLTWRGFNRAVDRFLTARGLDVSTTAAGVLSAPYAQHSPI